MILKVSRSRYKFTAAYTLYVACIQTSVWILRDQKRYRTARECEVCRVGLCGMKCEVCRVGPCGMKICWLLQAVWD